MKKIITVAALLAAMTAPATAQTFNKAQEKQIQEIAGKYLKEHPEVIIEALQNYQAKMEEEQMKANQEALKANRKEIEGGDMYLGNPMGKIVIVEFFDYNCGYCKSMFETLLKKVEGDKSIKLVLKELPSLGQDSADAAKVAIAAGKQKKYKEFHSAAMRLKKSLNKESALKIAKDLKLDMTKLEKDMNSGDTQSVIDRNRKLAEAIDGRAVPTFVIGDQIIPGAFDEQRLDEYIKKAKEKK